jgi:hypothetical protein
MAVREGVCQRVHSMSSLRFPPQRLLACPSEAKVPARVTLSHGGIPMRKLSMRGGVPGGSSYNSTLDPARVELP